MKDTTNYEFQEKTKSEFELLTEENIKLRSDLEFTIKFILEFQRYHDNPNKACNEYGCECPIQMSEWFDQEERDRVSCIQKYLKI